MPEDLIKFGLIPEFIGRLPVITSVRQLDRDALVEILTEPRNALVKQYAKLFELDNVELEFEQSALDAIADQAVLRGTGARGLRAIMEEVLLSVMYEVPSREDVARVVINRETVEQKLGREWETGEFQLAIVSYAGNFSEWDDDQIIVKWEH